jgi:hypothetical protein
MINEILYTVDFITSFLIKSKIKLPLQKIINFKNNLTKILIKNYVKYWDDQQPNKFRNLRSIKFSYHIDFQVLEAWKSPNVDLPLNIAHQIFPNDLIIYCDPNSVTFKHKQFVGKLYYKLL